MKKLTVMILVVAMLSLPIGSSVPPAQAAEATLACKVAAALRWLNPLATLACQAGWNLEIVASWDNPWYEGGDPDDWGN